MGENPQLISEWLDYIFQYGSFWVYALIFVACFIENIFPPFPGDSFIFGAGFLVCAERLDLFPSVMVVLLGGMGSVMVMYALGHKYGRSFFMRKDYKYFSVKDIEKFEINLSRFGAWLMIFSRFVVGFRSAIAVGAGIGRYSPIKMTVYSMISYLLFGGLLFYLSIVVADNFETISEYVRAYNMIVWPLLIIAIVTWIVLKVRKARLEAR